jgi:hypothetical protein
MSVGSGSIRPSESVVACVRSCVCVQHPRERGGVCCQRSAHCFVLVCVDSVVVRECYVRVRGAVLEGERADCNAQVTSPLSITDIQHGCTHVAFTCGRGRCVVLRRCWKKQNLKNPSLAQKEMEIKTRQVWCVCGGCVGGMATLPRRTSVCIGLFKVTSAIVFPSRGDADALQGKLVPCAPPLPGLTFLLSCVVFCLREWEHASTRVRGEGCESGEPQREDQRLQVTWQCTERRPRLRGSPSHRRSQVRSDSFSTRRRKKCQHGLFFSRANAAGSQFRK